MNTIGGFANWVQDAEYTICPHCGKPMKYLAQIQWDTVYDCAEGTLYVEFCRIAKSYPCSISRPERSACDEFAKA